MVNVIYACIVLIANVVGAISGLGGGTLIKPIFDAIGFHSLAEISFYSTTAVFVMAISSTYKQIKNKVIINWTVAIQISLGSIVGGLLGSMLFEQSLAIVGNESTVNLIQIAVAIITLIVSYLYTIYNWRSLELSSKTSYLFLGFSLGLISSYLGIGGGPLNVFILMWALGLSMKEAAVYSIVVIFFSQLSKLSMIVVTNSYQGFDMSPLLTIILAAILGGYLGAKASSKMALNQITTVYKFMVIITIIINISNAIKILF